MLNRASRRKQMHDLAAVRDQPVGDVRAVAIRRIALGTHQADPLRAIGKRSGRVAKQRGSHVFLVRALAVAAERLTLPFIGDAGLGKRGAEGLAGELRVASGNRKSAHVHDGADVRLLENRNQLGGAARAVTDGEDQAAFAAFFSAVCSALAFFFLGSSALGSAPCSARSRSVTSARGALSPLRKPLLRMRR